MCATTSASAGPLYLFDSIVQGDPERMLNNSSNLLRPSIRPSLIRMHSDGLKIDNFPKRNQRVISVFNASWLRCRPERAVLLACGTLCSSMWYIVLCVLHRSNHLNTIQNKNKEERNRNQREEKQQPKKRKRRRREKKTNSTNPNYK